MTSDAGDRPNDGADGDVGRTRPGSVVPPAVVDAGTPNGSDRRGWLPWSWGRLWRAGGTGAAVVALGCAWLLAVLWFVANGAPSAGGEPPIFAPPEPTPLARSIPVSDSRTPTPMGGIR